MFNNKLKLQLTQLQSTISTQQATITQLTTQLSNAQSSITTKDTELSQLRSQLTKIQNDYMAEHLDENGKPYALWSKIP